MYSDHPGQNMPLLFDSVKKLAPELEWKDQGPDRVRASLGPSAQHPFSLQHSLYGVTHGELTIHQCGALTKAKLTVVDGAGNVVERRYGYGFDAESALTDFGRKCWRPSPMFSIPDTHPAFDRLRGLFDLVLIAPDLAGIAALNEDQKNQEPEVPGWKQLVDFIAGAAQPMLTASSPEAFDDARQAFVQMLRGGFNMWWSMLKDAAGELLAQIAEQRNLEGQEWHPDIDGALGYVRPAVLQFFDYLAVSMDEKFLKKQFAHFKTSQDRYTRAYSHLQHPIVDPTWMGVGAVFSMVMQANARVEYDRLNTQDAPKISVPLPTELLDNELRASGYKILGPDDVPCCPADDGRKIEPEHDAKRIGRVWALLTHLRSSLGMVKDLCKLLDYSIADDEDEDPSEDEGDAQ